MSNDALRLVALGGPGETRSSKPGHGFELEFAREIHLESAGELALEELAGHTVEAGESLRYVVYPEVLGHEAYLSTFVAVDLVFSDGSRLSQSSPTDLYGFPASARGQGDSKIVVADQWNEVTISLEAQVGKEVASAYLVWDPSPADLEKLAQAPAAPRVWLDRVSIQSAAPKRDVNDFVTWVDTRRGSHSSGDFSRGNMPPIAAVPNGFGFWSPITDARSDRWVYEYHRRNDEQNRTRLEALGLIHQPSPWMGDSNQLFFMPGIGDVTADPKKRSRAFSHADEVAMPHLYSVNLDGGISASMAPTNHGAILEFATPAGESPWIVVDSIDESCSFEAQGDQLWGWVENGSNHGRLRMFVAAKFDRAPARWERPADGLHAAFAAVFDGAEPLTVRVATSFISVDQAWKNLDQELGAQAGLPSLHAVSESARSLWNERLGVIEVDSASDYERETLYGCLYRMNLYPNEGHENAGTLAEPRIVHASPVAPWVGENTDSETGAAIFDGEIYVNNGFWDTYRTMWPALALLYPNVCAQMVDGFIQQYREGGWVARWSSPGYADLMTGTSSDVAFADVHARGVTLIDAWDTYLAGVRNASVQPPNPAIGRKGLESALFTGYVSSDTHESVSWGLEGYINDFGLGLMAERLAAQCERGEGEFAGLSGAERAVRAQRLRDDAAYFVARSRNYGYVFDPRVGFFQGRAKNGEFSLGPGKFDPEVWGGDFTETDGWNFAYHVPHDGVGLAALHGGPEGLTRSLTEFFATPEKAELYGSYGFVIHEMIEAREVRMGQYGFSNQPAHHIAHTWAFSSKPDMVGHTATEVMKRLFVGGRIGQGYPGDEDNGEMSAWWVLNAIGLYPLRVGTDSWSLGAPLFDSARVKPLGGEAFSVVIDPESSANCPLVNNGGESKERRSVVGHGELAGSTLSFPSRDSSRIEWAVPPSITKPGEQPHVLADVLPHARVEIATEGIEASVLGALTNDAFEPSARVEGGKLSVLIHFDEPRKVSFVTLTSGTNADLAPSSFTLEASTDSLEWSVVCERSDVAFEWPLMARGFALETPASATDFRLSITGAQGMELSQIELLESVEWTTVSGAQ